MENVEAFILYRLPMSPPLRHVIDNARAARKPIIFDTDDLIFEPELIGAQRGVLKLSEEEKAQHAKVVRDYLETLLMADAVTTATPLKRGAKSFVHRNALGLEMSASAERLLPQRERSEKVIIGYGSGTPTHDFDFQEAASTLSKILDRFPKVELWIAGPLSLPAELGDAARVRRFPLTGWREWFELMSQFDLALAPLEMNNVFCQAKSEIKFVEAGALGLPVIASKTGAFPDAITHGSDGFLAANENEWMEALTTLIEQPERRREMGAQARRKVAQKYSPSARTADLDEILPHFIHSLGQCDPPKSKGWFGRIFARKKRALQINWLVPEPAPHAGGCVGIFRLIRFLAEFGHSSSVYVFPSILMTDFRPEEIRDYVEENFGRTPARYQRWNGALDPADCTFATFWTTAETLLTLPPREHRFYLVQDFEPSFYPGDLQLQERAEKTYRAGLHCLTLGRWLAKLLRERYGAPADHFDFAVDPKIYWPRPGLRAAHRRVCF